MSAALTMWPARARSRLGRAGAWAAMTSRLWRVKGMMLRNLYDSGRGTDLSPGLRRANDVRDAGR